MSWRHQQPVNCVFYPNAIANLCLTITFATMLLLSAALPLLGLSKASAQNVQPIYSFPQSPADPWAGLVEGPDGNFYGTTWAGGKGGCGAVIKVTPDGVLTTLCSFSPPIGRAGTFITNSDGVQPESALTLGPDDNFYGTTYGGGANTVGTVFKVTTNGVLTTLHVFGGRPDGANPEAGLTLGPDGNLYGTTSGGGTNGNGAIFRVTTNGLLTVVHSFTAGKNGGVNGYYTNSDGTGPYASLTLGPDGNFYGTTSAGGNAGSGTLFEVTTNGALTTFYTFSAVGYNNSDIGLPNTNSDGAGLTAALTLGSDGNFYGTTRGGGLSGSGTVFKVTPNGSLTTLYSFSGGRSTFIGQHIVYTNTDGARPYAGLTLTNGNIYGTASGGGSSGVGTLFEITSGGTFTKLLTFTNANGANPGGTLTKGSNGKFYGVTANGGSGGNGTVFELTTGGVLTTLINFAENNGALPYAGLTQGANGNFYGTTYGGGTNDLGTVFEATTNGILTTLVNFAGTNGSNPEAGLTLGPNGNFYGTTYGGGSNGYGTVFEITPDGVLTMLTSFARTNGAGPRGALTLRPDGNFYGTTVNGGTNNFGTVFEVTTNGVLTRLCSFTGGNDGENPQASLTLGPNGNLYGTTSYGGVGGYGTVFEVTTNGVLTTVHSFSDGSDGASPYAALTFVPSGNFYGTTAGNGGSTYGSVFEMTPNGALTNLHSFTEGNDSGSPTAALTLGPDGNLYGTTYGNFSGTPSGGGSNPCGTVFEVTSNGAFTTLVIFAGTNGMYSKANLVLGPDGNFYGTTSYGGSDGIGEIYRLDLPPEIIQQPVSQCVTAGAPVTLSVNLFGTAPYSFQWLSNSVPIVAATNNTLAIPNFAAGDAADYSVIVSNAWGGTTSSVASLTVWGGPLISSITLSANGNVTLNCLGLTNIGSRLWATTNLAAPTDWTPIFTNSPTSPCGAWEFTDTNIFYQQRYYRLSTP